MNEIRDFIAYAGSSAEGRRRDDVERFGGMGTGVTWKGEIRYCLKLME